MSLHRHFTGQNVALVVVFAAIIAVLTLAPEIALAGGVPISLQTLGVILTGLVLGPWRGFSAVALYTGIGLAGAPIFANNRGGFSVLAGATGGYVVGFLFGVIVVGLIARAFLRHFKRPNIPALLVAALASIPAVYAIGVPWLAARLNLPLWNAPDGCGEGLDLSCTTGMSAGVIPFIPGDLIKAVVATLLAASILRAYPQLLPRVREPRNQEDALA